MKVWLSNRAYAGTEFPSGSLKQFVIRADPRGRCSPDVQSVQRWVHFEVITTRSYPIVTTETFRFPQSARARSATRTTGIVKFRSTGV